MVTPTSQDSGDDFPLLSMHGISKSFPGVQALCDVDLVLWPGEVLALVGENGAGKSTLIKVLSGALRPDTGYVRLNGADPRISSPADARRAKIAVIYQEFNLAPSLTVRDNLFLGQEVTCAGFLQKRYEQKRTRELFDRLGVSQDSEAACRDLSVAQQQIVEIAKALLLDARIVVMDEPSASLSIRDVKRLFRVIDELKAQGIGVVYISHRLNEIFEIADRVTILRDGKIVSTNRVAEVSRDQLIEGMVGRQLDNEFPARNVAIGDKRLVVQQLDRGNAVQDVSFSVRRGEVVALTGLVGAGRTETARLIFGADRRDSGSICLDGKLLRLRSPIDALRAGICLLTEDRKLHGLILDHSIRENFSLPNLPLLSRMGFINRGQEKSELDHYIKRLKIKLSHAEQPAAVLSGGNQQKVVLAKWLAHNCDVIIFDEPTRGIDVGAKYEIYQLINSLASQGKAVVMISSELSEVLGMADRVLVMHGGRIAGEITDVSQTTQEQILELAIG